MHIQVFSPHFDDATLSCGEHILRWQKKGHHVEVINVFTEFEATVYSADSLDFMKKGNVESGKSFRDTRGKEDKNSLQILGVKDVRWLGLTDGGFREEGGRPTYRSHDHLFAAQILDSQKVQQKIEQKLLEIVRPEGVIVVPLGVGQHADHLLVKQALERTIPAERVIYYVDVPYAFQLGNWSFDQLKNVIHRRRSFQWSSSQKVQAVEAYHSQVPILFKTGMWQYPECCISHAAL